jgi:hypothetical protein
MGIAKLQQITAYFKNLSGEQQASIMRWTGVSVGMLGVMTLLPRLGAGLSTISKTLYGMAATNPFLLIAGGLVALLSRTEEGRTALSEIGHSMMEAFTAAAELLMSVLVPALDFLTEALSGPGGKVILLGTLFLAASVKIIGAIRSISAAAMTLGGPIGIALAAIGAVVAALTMANSGTKEFMGNVTNVLGEVRKGTTTKEQAKEQIRRNAEIQAEEEAEKASKGWGKYDPWRDTNEERVERRRKSRVEELTKAGEERLETGLKRLPGQGRSDLVQSRTGTEDARATLKRLEDSIIKSGANELAKQQLEELKDIKDELRKKPGGNRNDERENPPKGW